VRAWALPLAAVLLVALLLGTYAAAGGTDYAQVQGAADPCKDRAAADRPVPARIEPLAERVVLLGLDSAACRLGVSRERLVLALPVRADRQELARELGTDEAGLARALKAGLLRAVARLDRAGQLPKASALLPEVVGELGLPGAAEGLVEAIPEETVDSLAPTGPVLRRAIRSLNVEELLAGLGDSDRLEDELRDAVAEAALDEIRERLLQRVPGSLQGLLGD